MPHDLNGQEVKEGDKVLVPCVVKYVSETPENCNVTLETQEPMFPGIYKSCISLNSKQVQKES